MKKLVTLTFLATILSFPALGGPIKTGTGGPNGNYFSMGNDINAYCGSALPDGKTIEILNTKGSIENLMGMTSKKYSAGWVQEDVLQYFAKQTPTKVNRNRIKILIGGHQESVHILIPPGWQPKGAGGSWREKLAALVSNKPPEGISLNSLKGQTIGSWGGSLVSAKALSSFTGLGLNIVEITEGQTGANPILLVGGQPYKPVTDFLAKGYTLLPINSSTVSEKAPFYVKDTLNYEVGGKIMSVPSFGVRAHFTGKAFRSEARNATMIALATCLSESLLDLADDPDTNPNWSSVVELEENGQTNWSYFKLN